MLDHLCKRVTQTARVQIMALHDANLATCYCCHVLLLFGQGEWALGRSDALLNEKNLSRLYGCRIRCVKDGKQEVFAIGTNS